MSEGFRPVFVPARPMGDRISSYETAEQLQQSKRRFLRALAVAAAGASALIHALW